MKVNVKPILCCFAMLISVGGWLTACDAAQPPVQPQVLPASGADITPAVVVITPTAVNTPLAVISPLKSPRQPTPEAISWSTFTLANGVSFQYPSEWKTQYPELPADIPEFVFNAAPPESFDWIQIIVRSAPQEEENSLYHYAGDVIDTRQKGAYKTVWDKTITSHNKIEWHLAMRGFTSLSPNIDGIAYIGEAGGLTEGTIEAVHYDPASQLAIQLSKDLDRDMLIALHESGPDAVYPAMVPVFQEIVDSVALAGQ